MVLAAFAYSLFAVFVKTAYDRGLTPTTLFTWRFLLALPAAWAVAALAGEARSRELPRRALVLNGILFGAVALSAVAALERLPASLYIVVIYTYPAMVTLVGVARGERPDRTTWWALAMATVGVVLTVPDVLDGFGSVDVVGLLLALLNAALYAAYIVVSGHLLVGRRSLLAAAAWSITGSTLVAVGLAAVGTVDVPQGAGAWGALVGVAVVSTVLAGATFLGGLARLGPTDASILSTVEPVLAIVWAVALLDEVLDPLQLAGAGLVLTSLVLLQRPRSRRSVTAVAAEAFP